MDYEGAAEQLKEKIDTLNQVNIQLRNELAVALNNSYVYTAKTAVIAAEKERVAKMTKDYSVMHNNNVAQMEDELRNCRTELELIKSSNMYKLWILYGRMPKPVHKLLRGMTRIAKAAYHSLKKVFA